MKLTMEELLSRRPEALKNRVLCYSQYENMSGSKPRDPEETLMLALLTVNRALSLLSFYADKLADLREKARNLH